MNPSPTKKIGGVQKMNRSNVIKLAMISLVVCVFVLLSFSALSWSQNFKMLTDVLDSFGGRASSTNFSLRVGSGGQPGVVGPSEDSSFYAWQGYVHAAIYLHRDVNANGEITVSDVVYLIGYVLKSGPAPIPLETGDVNCDNIANITDITDMINYLFKSGPPLCDL
jgi:hypothetical protein